MSEGAIQGAAHAGKLGLGSILTAIVTPFDEQGRVDEESFVALMAHLAGHGSKGFVVCGTTGEAATLTDEEHLGLIGLAVRERPTLADGRPATVVGGTGSNDTRHAIHLTEVASELGVDATLSVTPYYNKPSPRGIVRHYEEVAKATDRPILLYNIPGRCVVNIGPELLARLAQIEHIDGLKQANPDELQLIDGLDLYAGDDTSFARTLEIGGAGGVCVASHVIGEVMRQMVEEPARRAELEEIVQDVHKTLFMTASPTCTKAALNMLGHKVGGLRLPLIEADEHERSAVHAMLVRNGLLDASPSALAASRGGPAGTGTEAGAHAQATRA
jgi:4-hydroxy-tetrahydrodipicolinate synthase